MEIKVFIRNGVVESVMASAGEPWPELTIVDFDSFSGKEELYKKEYESASANGFADIPAFIKHCENANEEEIVA